jgi:adenylate cyclase
MVSWHDARDQAIAALVTAAISGAELPRLLETLCRTLRDAGVSASRVAIGTLLVHPLLDATLVVWRAAGGSEVIDTPRPAIRGDEVWRRSPFYRLVVADTLEMRHRLHAGEGIADDPILAGFAAAGGTDYIVLRTPLQRAGMPEGSGDLFSSWVSDRQGGFLDVEIDLIRRLQPLAAVIFTGVLNASTAGTLLATYLGADAAGRVLAGAIERGGAETIDAVIWFSDLEGFTRLSDTLPRQELLNLLNGYTERIVDAIEAEGGEVLKFIGDGILAIFRQSEPAEACAAALRGWRAAHAATDALTEARQKDGLAATRPYLALHRGEVLYGNIGGKARLDFTVLGLAVNEAVRMAGLSRDLDQQAIISEAFAMTSGPERDRLAGLGRFALRGVSRPQLLYTLGDAG